MRRELRRRATDRALRRAAYQLIGERGYEAATTEEIARAAGVSPRTFFNYFPTKESLFQLPGEPLAELLEVRVVARPAGEEPVASVTAATREAFGALDAAAGDDDRDVMLTSMRLMQSDPLCRAFFHRRREAAETAAWGALRRRGVRPDDLSARAAATTVVALAFLAVAVWAEGDGAEPLPDVFARCLRALPGTAG